MKWQNLGSNGPWINREPETNEWCAAGINQWSNGKGFTFVCVVNGAYIRGPARTLKEAKANCEAHVKRYGRKP